MGGAAAWESGERGQALSLPPGGLGVHSAGDNQELVEGGDVGKAALLGGDVNVLGGNEGLQLESLQDGAEEEEELHPGQGLAEADPLP